MAERKLQVGDRVKWNISAGQAEGEIVRVARRSGSIKGFDYKASPDDPRYIVKTDEGKHAAHKAGELRKA